MISNLFKFLECLGLENKEEPKIFKIEKHSKETHTDNLDKEDFENGDYPQIPLIKKEIITRYEGEKVITEEITKILNEKDKKITTHKETLSVKTIMRQI